METSWRSRKQVREWKQVEDEGQVTVYMYKKN